ncbi:MAG TPA: MFS transporter, partial [Rubrivivax sp.]|nr:MFS transporter [Rubrivivax sp.]
LVNRYGLRAPLATGLLLGALGLALFARAPVSANFWLDVLPGMLLLGVAAGIAFNPLLLAAMSDVPESEAGLASGIVNTGFMMGGAFGLAVLASIAAAATAGATAGGAAEVAALAVGYRWAFGVGAVATLLAAAMALLLRQPPGPQPVAHAAGHAA